MRDEGLLSVGLHEIRLKDARLPRLHSEEMRFQAANRLVEFFARRSGARVVSWCVEGEEVIVLAEGGECAPAQEAKGPSRADLLAAARGEYEKALQYRRA